LVEAWVATVLDALEEENARVGPFDHKVARALLPDYLEELGTQAAEVAELDATIKEAVATTDDEDVEEEPSVSPAELKALKARLAATKRKVSKGAFADRLVVACEALDDPASRSVVLAALERDLLSEADDRITRHRREVVSTVQTLWDKYRFSLAALEEDRLAASETLGRLLKDYGYA
jgi:type I restriction enzyme M protein